MRDLLLTIVIPAALLAGLFSPQLATLVLMWIGFQRPYDFSWGLWNALPTWTMAFAVAFISNAVRGELRPKFPLAFKLYLLLIAWITITSFTAFLPERSWLFYRSFMIPLLFGPLLTLAIINDLKLLKGCLWVAAGGLGLNAAKTGASLGLAGGSHVTEQISGFVGDNNVFGLTLCLVVGTLLGLRRSMPPIRFLRPLFYVAVALIILTIIFTKSRGALLSLGVVLVTASVLGGKPVRHLVLLAVLAGATYAIVPASYFGRLETLNDVSADASAMGRVENWRLAWKASVENPVFGIGIGNHMPYHQSQQSEVYVRVAHSTYFQVLGELSFLGLFLYISILLVTLWTCWRLLGQTKAIAAEYPDLAWTNDLSFWLLCSFMGYVFGSAFLNMLYIEFPWYLMFFTALLRPMILREVNTRRAAAGLRGTEGSRSRGRPLGSPTVGARTRSV